ncbi:MAG: hypothetical protein ACRDJN_24420, partial [Chloroflexota bacterium]
RPVLATARDTGLSRSRHHDRLITRALDQAQNRLQTVLSVRGDDRTLQGELARGGASEFGLTFGCDKYVLVGQDGKAPPCSYRANVVRDGDGRVAWLSNSGRDGRSCSS